MSLKSEQISQTEAENEIFQLLVEPTEGSINVYKVNGGIETPLSFTYLEDRYVQVAPAQPVGTMLKFTYTSIENNTTEKLLAAVRRLEKDVEFLKKENTDLKEAVNNRVNVTAMQAWFKLIEEKLEISLIDGKLGSHGMNTYKGKYV